VTSPNRQWKANTSRAPRTARRVAPARAAHRAERIGEVLDLMDRYVEVINGDVTLTGQNAN
jgi:hypothetical protein